MNTDVLGKVREKRLSHRDSLLPLFEAVVNSIHAIEDLNRTNTTQGIIDITVIRSPQTELNSEDGEKLRPIIDFYIKDNGIGFTKENYESFDYANSTYKLERGGKGLGRFTWLRAFGVVEIESYFFENDEWHRKVFKFLPVRDGIEPVSDDIITDKKERHTEVRLKGLFQDHQKWCNFAIGSIAQRIIEHCFAYFLLESCPIIRIIDGEDQCVANDLFKEYTKGKIKTVPFKINDQDFNLDLVRFYSSKADNKIHYCAHSREVQKDSIAGDIPEISGLFADENNEKFSISAYVAGKYFDDNVNNERTEISFETKREDNSLFDEQVITKDDIKKEVLSAIKQEFQDIISSIAKEREKNVKGFIQNHPRYRSLLKYRVNDLYNIPSKLSDDKLEVELFKIQQKLDLEVRIESKEILNSLDNVEDIESFRQQYDQTFQKIIEVGNSKLSEYVVHRKMVLDLLDKHIKKDKQGKYCKESAIHHLVFPMQSESDDIGFDDHNLWVIDERLAFHKYLASDKSLKKNKEAGSDATQRPDIIIHNEVFNKPFALSGDDKPYSSIVIVEFKRPMRDDYTDAENPITQVNNYVRKINENSINDKNGRPFDLRAGTPAYAYIVCDLTPKMREFAENAGYIKMPDNDGYFTFNPNHNLYVEIVSFDKLLVNSQQRNKALFEKLNLPTT
jgi:hypothetical protein